jgi:hypothetical protein
MKTAAIILLALTLTATAAPPDKTDPQPIVFHGLSDPSAAIALSPDMFIVADDETNALRVYKTDNTRYPVYTYDLSRFLAINPDHPEADIEAATIVDNRIYWITSHGRNKDGKPRPNRYRFFATDIKIEKGRVSVEPAGRPCPTLVYDMLHDNLLNGLGLEQATRFGIKMKKKQLKQLAPKEQGLNIEGLAASPDGKTLFIAFRNPRPKHPVTGKRMALVIPLTNPQLVIEKAAPPKFAKPILWDLEGMAIRSIEYSQYHKAFFLIAGPHDGKSDFTLYKWSGTIEDHPKPVKKIQPDNFTPEAIMPLDNSDKLILLSDDGNIEVMISDPSQCLPGEFIAPNKCKNKHLAHQGRRTFRLMTIKP